MWYLEDLFEVGPVGQEVAHVLDVVHPVLDVGHRVREPDEKKIHALFNSKGEDGQPIWYFLWSA